MLDLICKYLYPMSYPNYLFGHEQGTNGRKAAENEPEQLRQHSVSQIDCRKSAEDVLEKLRQLLQRGINDRKAAEAELPDTEEFFEAVGTADLETLREEHRQSIDEILRQTWLEETHLDEQHILEVAELKEKARNLPVQN